uniref:VG15 protein n=1 Tax=Nocardia suismassiliense TaxID=2077092 RepID=UPI003F493F9D
MTTVAERQQLLDELSRLATQDITALWHQIATASDAEFSQLLIQAFPELLEPYSVASAELGAEWYAESTPPRATYQPTSFLPEAGGLSTSAEWALGATGEAALDRLAGIAQRQIWNANRDTIIGNAAAEPGSTWARVARPGACAFCAMLATRADVYASEAAALSVVGRGKSGRTRGSRKRGERYHDHCHCQAKEVRPGQVYIPPAYVQEWEDAYIKATRETARTGKYGAIDTKAVLAHMRATLTESRAASRLDDLPSPAPVPMVAETPHLDTPPPAAQSAVSAAASEVVDASSAPRPRKGSRFAGQSSEDLMARFTAKIEAEEFDDEFDALEAEVTRRDRRAQAERDRRAANRDAKARAQDAEYERLMNDGVDDETAIEQAYGVPVPEQRRRNARSTLSGWGYDGKGLDEQVRAWHRDEAHRAWLSAEDATNGYMLSKAGEKAGVDPRQLWSMPEDRARKYASEELRGWWDEHGRMTPAELKAQLTDPVELVRIQSRGRDYLQ